MRKMNLLVFVGLLISFVFQSCMKNDDCYNEITFPNALVTVKLDSNKTVFLQLNDTTTLYPVNIKTSPFNKEVRALVNYKEVNEPKLNYTKSVYVNWIDSILTKKMAPDYTLRNDALYGNDPVEIIKDWVTVSEDGYLTLRFRTRFGDLNRVHNVNLIYIDKKDDSYSVEFRHNAKGDNNGILRDAIVAFKLNDLPNTNGKNVKLKLRWKSFSGDKSTDFNYCTQSNSLNKILPPNRHCNNIN